MVATQDLGEITREKLKGYKGVVFYTTGELEIDKEALIDFVKAGGGFAGIHSATDTLYKYAPYGELVGGYFDGHPWHEKVTVKVEDTKHPATAHLGDELRAHRRDLPVPRLGPQQGARPAEPGRRRAST